MQNDRVGLDSPARALERERLAHKPLPASRVRERRSAARSACLLAVASVYCLTVCGTAASADETEADMIVRTSSRTGLVSFVVPREGEAKDFLRKHGQLFNVADPDRQLVHRKESVGPLGHTHTTYDQMHRGIHVFSGELKLHADDSGRLVAANGRVYPIPPSLPVEPTLSAATAIRVAQDTDAALSEVVQAELVIVDPGWYGDPSIGAHLAYYLMMADSQHHTNDAFFIDAHRGTILDQWSMVCRARDRKVHLHNNIAGEPLPGPVSRSEIDPPTGVADVDEAFDYLGDTYLYYAQAFGRDSYDDAGGTMVVTVNSSAIQCPNAGWMFSLEQSVFCPDVVSDDMIAHEFTHGVTQHTANLIYQNQPGQLNESFSDIFGELIDLFNGDAAFVGATGGPPFWPTHPTGPGMDTENHLRSTCSIGPEYYDGVRWVFGEDATGFGSALRDLWDPTCLGDPDRANSPLQTCSVLDNGGVHSGSCIPSHAFAMLTDGKSFNGYTVTGIGPIKAGAVWYRALTVYLTVGSDFEDAYWAFNQAATDLIGATPNDPRTGLPSSSVFTAADAAEVDKALLAVEMNTAGACGQAVPVLDSDPPVRCTNRTILYADDFENGPNGWMVFNSGPRTPYDWAQTSGPLPWARLGTAWHCETPILGECEGFSFATGADACVDADLIEGEGTYDFDTSTATLDGPADCNSGGSNDIDHDVWFCWAADCDGMVTIETCGLSGIDTKIAVYDGCSCPPPTLLACDDDGCGAQSSVSFAATDGASYLIRIGTPPGSPGGTGEFSITSVLSCGESGVHSLVSPVIHLPAILEIPELSFTHYTETEPKWDGGHLALRVNGGPWQAVPQPSFRYNGYNTTLLTVQQGNLNPNAGQLAFSGVGGQWGTTIVDLGPYVIGGDTLEVRFDLSKDRCFGITGWWVDDIEVSHCDASLDCNNNGVADEVDRASGPHRAAFLVQPPNHSSGNPSDLDNGGLGVTAMADNLIVVRPQVIEQVRLWGGYFPDNSAPADHFTIIIHEDDAGTPGSVVATRSDIPSDRWATGQVFLGSWALDEYDILLTLDDPISLAPGVFFIEILNDTTDSTDTFIWQRALVGHILGAFGAYEAPGGTWIHDPLINMSVELYGPVIGRALADVDGNGTVTMADIDAFVEALLTGTDDLDAFCAADINTDTQLDGADIQGFTACIIDGGCL